MSVIHNEYAGYTLKHLLLRHMYNLSLPNYLLLYWLIHPRWSPNCQHANEQNEPRTVLYGGLNSKLV